MTKKLMVIAAHPDDESLGAGGLLAKYAAEGVETSLIIATRGERGWQGTPETYPGETALGEIREAELRAACDVLGVSEVVILDYIDGELDQADPATIARQLRGHINRIQPQVVVTFDPFGAYGHPDHIAISQFATAAIIRASYRIPKFYYMVDSWPNLKLYEDSFGELIIQVDGENRCSVGWNEWAITTRIDTSDYWEQAWQAIICHQTQIPHEVIEKFTPAMRKQIWGTAYLYRTYSLVNGGRKVETDLFEGIEA